VTPPPAYTPRTAIGVDAVERLDRIVRDLIDRLGNLGALVVIDIEGLGRVSVTAGYADCEHSRAVGPDDIFQIGSQSKTITAMLLVLLAREGRLDLDAPVRDYVDLPIDRRITPRQLLMNTSGLGEFSYALGDQFDMRIAFAPRDLVALALPQGQLFEPGDRFDYCNTGWVIAAMIAEAVTHKRYGDLVAEKIIAPLDLRNTAFGSFPPGHAMHAYWTLPSAPEPVDITGELSWAYGCGDGIASASDILAIYQSLLRADSPLGITLADLTATTARPSQNPTFAMSLGLEYALGLERRAWAGREVWGHPGSTEATRSATWIDAGAGVSIATAVTIIRGATSIGDEFRYPREQLFAMALQTGYSLATERADRKLAAQAA
jgi:D-alanyl-D-alanine carboxypeptidase